MDNGLMNGEEEGATKHHFKGKGEGARKETDERKREIESHTQILRYPREQRLLEDRGFNTLQETSTEVREDLHKGTEVESIFEPVHSAGRA